MGTEPISSVGAVSSANNAAASRAKKKQGDKPEQPVQVTEVVTPDLNKGVAVEHNEEVVAEEGAEDKSARTAVNEREIAELNAIKEQTTSPVVDEVVKEKPAPASPKAEEQRVEVSAEDAASAAGSAASRRKAKGQTTPPPVNNTPAEEVKEEPVQVRVEEPKPEEVKAEEQQEPTVVATTDVATAKKLEAERKKNEQLQRDLEAERSARAKENQRANDEIALLKKQAAENARQMAAINARLDALNNAPAPAPAEEVKAEDVVAGTPEKPVEDGRPRPEPGYEYLMDLNTKELKKLVRSKDEDVARNAKLELEGRKHDRNIWTPSELSENERSIIDAAVEASGVDKPFYKNKKAQRLLKKQLKNKSSEVVEALDRKIEEAKTEEEKEALKLFRDALDDKNTSNKYAKTVVKDLVIGDRVEHTVVVDSYEDKKKAKQKLGDEAEDFRVKRHNKRFMKHNAEVKAAMADKGISSHQAVYEQISGSEEDPRRISGDRTFEKSEIITETSYASDDKNRYLAVRNELRKLGYKIDDDLAKKIIMPILSVLAAAGGPAAGIIFSGGLSTVVEATATALAEISVVVPELGVNIAASSSSNASTSLTVNHWQNSAVSAALPAAAALISAAVFGSETEEIDLLKNHDMCDLFKDVSDGNGGTTRAFEQASFGNKKKTEGTKAILREIDALDLTDKEKVALLNAAAGNKGRGKITSKELILAYIKGMDQVAGAEKKSPVVKPCETCDDDKIEEEKPCPCENDTDSDSDIDIDMDTDTDIDVVDREKYVTVDVEGTKTRTIKTVKWGGPYHYAQFYLVDGKPIKYNSPEYKAIIAKLNNGAMMEANGRKDRVLNEEIDLGNGKVAHLVPDERIEEIRAKFRTKPGGKDVKYTSVTTKEGYTILYKVKNDGSKIEIKRGTKSAMEAECARLNKIEEDKVK